MTSDFATVEIAIEKLARGGVVIVLDSADRENEGDFLAAAELITSETIHFMITHGRGHLCQPVLPGTAARLDAQPLVPSIGPETPRFAMPLDFRECTTGISPLDRAMTIRSIVEPSSRADDFLRPGHIFPLIAREGGVLKRPGHTEAAVDMTALAGLTPSGVLCEICSGDGHSMAKVAELKQLAIDHDLPIVTIDSLIDYRRDHAPEINSAKQACDLVDDLSAHNASKFSNPREKASEFDWLAPILGADEQTVE